MTNTPLDKACAGLLELKDILASHGGYEAWVTTLSSLVKLRDDDKGEFVYRVKLLYGGMGSFADIVIQTPNGVVDRDRQRRLQVLRDEVFDAIYEGQRPVA